MSELGEDEKPWRKRPPRHGEGAGFLSPVVRRLAGETGVDVRTIQGSGAGGRVTRADVLEHANTSSPRTTVEPFTAIRRTTARNVLRAKQAAAHAHVSRLCDYERVEGVRRASGLTYLPFVARAVIDALRAYPHCNATSADDSFVVHEAMHLGIAVDLAFEGLILPVVRDADALRLPALARAIADLATRARSRHLDPNEVVGGTFTITNPGPFGTFLSAPIINVPQVAILATDAVRKRVVAVPTGDGGEGLAIRHAGMLSLGFDHRVIDGAYAASFLRRVVELVETRDWAAEL